MTSMICIPLAHNCRLLLTPEEYRRGILRGKLERRREANEKRTLGDGNILEVVEEERDE